METADNHQQTTAQGKGRNTGIVIAAVIALTLVAVWLVPGNEPEHADIPLPAAQPAPDITQKPALSSSTGDIPPPGKMEEGQEAREFIAMAKQSGASLDTLFNRAQELTQAGKLVDAHLLYFQAARQGHAGASMVLAKQADPATYSTGSSVLNEPDITQARKWYLAAANAGDDTAEDLLEKLQQYVQAQAAAGDPEASRLLLQWK